MIAITGAEAPLQWPGISYSVIDTGKENARIEGMLRGSQCCAQLVVGRVHRSKTRRQ